MEFPKAQNTSNALSKKILNVFFTNPNPKNATKHWASFCTVENDVIKVTFNTEFANKKEIRVASINRALVSEVYNDMVNDFEDERVVAKMSEAISEDNPRKIDLEIVDLLIQTAIFGSPTPSEYAPKN